MFPSMITGIVCILEMPLVLYYSPCSGSCHSIMLTAKALGLDLDLELIDIWKDENFKPEYLKVCILFQKTQKRTHFC